MPAYGPTILVSIGQGAKLPLVALSARDLGASLGVAAFVVALIGIGQLLGDLPAGALAARIGEQKALVTACAVDAVALLGAFLARSLGVLALAIFVTGLAGAVFSLARQAYLTETVPVRMRARALSTLGGTFRVGLFIGPFVGAALVSGRGVGTAYGFAAAMSLSAALLTAFLPDVTRTQRTARADSGAAHASVLSVLRQHRRTLLTLGTGVLVISAARATRQTIVPLWAASQGLSPSTVSLVYGVSAGVDMLLFYPGGAIMDRFGRVFVAVPSMVVLGLGFVLLPLTHATPAIAAVAGLMGLGNGISAGVVMTLGADAAPREARTQFLGGWRLFADLGNAAGPLIVSAVTVVAPLAAAAVTMGLLTWTGVAWLARWIPRRPPGTELQ
ncbi:Predicted arabinose efflux permease, MFS family [Microlunatus flavus]|uniref:Predicted arabinose efflux permease, MFS family n=1 Tax=Microlunatus flavus TaxID=1036181 RepID=A0A1H9CRP0_9ACTN|nr:Predicted arabinose efflux permease, MFS family [Microlunatus flavus]